MGMKKIGVLWDRKDKKQEGYQIGQLDLGVFGEASIAIYKSKKDNDNQPDYVVFQVTKDK